MKDCQEDDLTARETARPARTIHVNVENGQFGIVRAGLAVSLAVKSSSWQSFTDPGSHTSVI